MSIAARISEARVAGEAVAKAFVDAAEERNKRPNEQERQELRKGWDAYFQSQHIAWTDPELVATWKEAAEAYFVAQMKFHAVPRPTGSVALDGAGNSSPSDPERGWGGPFGISR